jgi:hypothetical protein
MVTKLTSAVANLERGNARLTAHIKDLQDLVAGSGGPCPFVSINDNADCRSLPVQPKSQRSCSQRTAVAETNQRLPVVPMAEYCYFVSLVDVWK